MAAIVVKNLHKKFLNTIAVDDISFEIPYGEITALLGSNGAGKSTTLNMIAGILIPTSGSIEFSGLNYEDNYKEVKSKIGYLTCDMALYESFSIKETLNIIGELKGYDRHKINKRIAHLTEVFGLGEILNKHFNELSSGQKQRSMIATTLIHDPEILIFDEVTASLDLVISKDIMDFLIEEKKKGKAIIFSTHILSEVEYISDRILMIEKGKLVKETNCEELIKETQAENVTNAFYRALVEEQGQK